MINLIFTNDSLQEKTFDTYTDMFFFDLYEYI